MPPKAQFTKDQIVAIAFDYVRKNGWESLSARYIARKLGSSTRPIYSSFQSMASLKETVFKQALDLLFHYQTTRRTEDPFLDMGLGTIMFARQENHLFRFLNDERNILIKKKFDQAMLGAALNKLADYERFAGFSEEIKRDFMFTMWVYTLGMAVLIDNTWGEDWSDADITEMLRETGVTFWHGYRRRLEQAKPNP